MKIYIDKLINNLPDIDYGDVNLILDGGAFSGSYILGTLYYIKELEKLNRINIKKMSGCSIGSILCILYKLNDLDYCCEVYTKIREYFKIHGNLCILQDIMSDLLTRMPEKFYRKCNNKIFLSYYDVKNNRSVVKKKFKNNSDLIETMYRSSYIPFICGRHILYKNRYIDGLKPYVFPKEKTIFVNLCMDYKCLTGMLNIRNEVNNMERIMTGILDIHTFLLTGNPTSMCYFTDNMTYSQKILHIFRLLIINIIISISYLMYHGYQSIKNNQSFMKYNDIIKILKTYFKKITYTYLKFFMV
jgi:hypothetical protein